MRCTQVLWLAKGWMTTGRSCPLETSVGFSRFLGIRSECCLCHPLEGGGEVEALALQAQRGCENHILPYLPFSLRKQGRKPACQEWVWGSGCWDTVNSSVVFASKEDLLSLPLGENNRNKEMEGTRKNRAPYPGLSLSPGASLECGG